MVWIGMIVEEGSQDARSTYIRTTSGRCTRSSITHMRRCSFSHMASFVDTGIV